MLPTFSQNLTLQEAFETAAQINEERKITKFDVAFGKKFKFVIDRFSSFFFKRRKSVENGPSKEKYGSPNVQDS